MFTLVFIIGKFNILSSVEQLQSLLTNREKNVENILILLA